jgi:hypothetical protein
LTHLDLEILRPKEKKQIALQQVRKAIEQQLAEYFRQFRFKKETLEKNYWLKSFVNLFQKSDAIINVNYDCFLEGLLDYHEVWSPKGGYVGGYVPLDHNPFALSQYSPLLDSEFPQNEKNIRIFKVHGSEHFIEEPRLMNKTKTSLGFAVDESIYPRSGKHRFFWYPNGVPGAYIIAPSFVKIPHQDIETMMIEALKTAAFANNFIVIGCSLRSEDSFLWLLLTSFLDLNRPLNNRKLVIVDPCAEKLAKKIFNHYFVDISEFVRMKTVPKKVQEGIPELIAELQEIPTEGAKETPKEHE